MENIGLRESKEGSCHRTFQLTTSRPGFLRAPPISIPGGAVTCFLGSFCLQVGSSLYELRPIKSGPSNGNPCALTALSPVWAQNAQAPASQQSGLKS